jgi:hypothetical protein
MRALSLTGVALAGSGMLHKFALRLIIFARHFWDSMVRDQFLAEQPVSGTFC